LAIPHQGLTVGRARSKPWSRAAKFEVAFYAALIIIFIASTS
jgi:hypothetical protein